MLRKIIKIDENKCNGCGACAAACHEGAIDMVDGKAKLMREAERCGGDMSAYIRSLIENRLSQAAGTCYNCIGRLEKALDAEDVGYELHSFIRSKYKAKDGES